MATESRVLAGDPRFNGAYDTVQVTQTGGNVVERQVVVLGSPDSLAYLTGSFLYDASRGAIAGISSVNKFGQNVDIDTAQEDVWTGGATWAGPTQARTHQIASTSTSDDGAPAGTGARTIRIFGLTDWDTAEVSEDITMNGTTNVASANNYVIIHRMQVLTKGAAGPNVGLITATADVDATVTAQIAIGNGQTLMAIYGVPSVQTLYMGLVYASVQKANAASVDMRLLVNPEPDAELTGFLVKQVFAISSTGTALAERNFQPYYAVAGPAIVKLAGESSANNASVSGGFDGLLVTN